MLEFHDPPPPPKMVCRPSQEPTSCHAARLPGGWRRPGWLLSKPHVATVALVPAPCPSPRHRARNLAVSQAGRAGWDTQHEQLANLTQGQPETERVGDRQAAARRYRCGSGWLLQAEDPEVGTSGSNSPVQGPREVRKRKLMKVVGCHVDVKRGSIFKLRRPGILEIRASVAPRKMP